MEKTLENCLNRFRLGWLTSLEDASAPSTKPTELREMPHWLVRPHGAVVEPRGRQRVKVPKRCGQGDSSWKSAFKMCTELCTHVPISSVVFSFLIYIGIGMQIYKFLIFECVFSLWLVD